MRRSRIHVCPLGLRCAGVPIALGNQLLGLAKLVCDPGISEKRFRVLVGLLETLVTRPCLNLQVFLLREHIRTQQVAMNRLRRAKAPARSGGNTANRSATSRPESDSSRRVPDLICQILNYLEQQYTVSGLSLRKIAGAVGRNEKYVAHLLVQQVGQRMHAYVTALRVRRSCELLLQTTQTIEQISRDSGFSHVAQFRQAFRRIVGVTASEYRQIFSAGAQPPSSRLLCEFEKCVGPKG